MSTDKFAKPNQARPRLALVATQKRKPDLDREQRREAARRRLVELVQTVGEGKRVAELLGVSPSLVSEAISGGRAVGPKLADALAKHLEISLDEVYGGAPLRATFKPERYPNLVEALALIKPDHETDRRMRTIAMSWPTDLTLGEWVDEVKKMAGSVKRAAELGRAYDDDDTPPEGR